MNQSIKLIVVLFFLSSATYSQAKVNLTLIENLEQKDTLFIRFSSIGDYDYKCGITKKNVLKIYYLNGNLTAQTIKNGKPITTKIETENKDFLVATEKQSHLFDDENKSCKYSDGYWYYVNDIFKFRIIDQSCEWHGFSKMTEKLFGFVFPE